MRVRFFVICLSLITVAAGVSSQAGIPLIVDDQLTRGDNSSFNPFMSADGRYAFFHSHASNLVTGDANGRPDVFMAERASGTMRLLSNRADGSPSIGYSFLQGVSGDGAVLSILSDGRLTPDAPTSPGLMQYVFDRSQNTRELIPYGYVQALSHTGRYMARTDWSQTIFVDRVTGSTTLLGYGSTVVAISDDGQTLLVKSPNYDDPSYPGDTNGKADAYLYDVPTQLYRRISVPLIGGESDADAIPTGMSRDGGVVIFESAASNLVPGGCIPVNPPSDNRCSTQVYYWDSGTGLLSIASTSTAGVPANKHAYYSSISSDGRFVAFFTASTTFNPAFGAGAMFNGGIYVRDLTARTTVRIDGLSGQVDPFAHSGWPQPRISSDGSSVAFIKSGLVDQVAGNSSSGPNVLVATNPLMSRP